MDTFLIPSFSSSSLLHLTIVTSLGSLRIMAPPYEDLAVTGTKQWNKESLPATPKFNQRFNVGERFPQTDDLISYPLIF